MADRIITTSTLKWNSKKLPVIWKGKEWSDLASTGPQEYEILQTLESTLSSWVGVPQLGFLKGLTLFILQWILAWSFGEILPFYFDHD